MSTKYLSAPIAKVVETEDGGREVWGFASVEVVDKSGEIADFAGTVAAFDKWSSDTEKRTGGKSKGNVRLMHNNIAAGKMIHWEPAETTVLDADGAEQTVKGIWVGDYVPPTKPDIIRDIDEGILSAFSIGGDYGKRWWSADDNAFRFIPVLAEHSLVDNPCCPGADIVNVISKGAGPWDKQIGGEVVDGELSKKNLPGSFEDLSNRINAACEAKFKQPFRNYWDGYIVNTFPDHVIVYDYDQCKYFSVPYTDADGTVTIGDPTEVQQTYIPIETQKLVATEIAKRELEKKKAKGDNDKLKEAAETRAKTYGISFKDKGHLTPPKDDPTSEDDYGDPVNYSYPIDDSHLKAAVSYFNQDGQMSDGGYTSEEWEIVGKRIAARSGEGYSYKDGKIETPTEEGATKLTLEDLTKAAQEAGLTVEQIRAFFGKLTPLDQPPAPIDVPTVDGDADIDGNGEGKPGSDGIDIAGGQKDVAAAEGATAGKATGATLQKEGKAVSAANMTHLQHAVGHLNAVMQGTPYGPDEHLKVESQNENSGPNSGLEAPEVDATKTYHASLQKSMGALISEEVSKSVSGAVDKLEALIKSLPTADALAKTVEHIEAVEALVKEIHAAPQSGGPVMAGGSPMVAEFFKQGKLGEAGEDTLEKFIKETTDPMLRDKMGQELAMRRAKNNFPGGSK